MILKILSLKKKNKIKTSVVFPQIETQLKMIEGKVDFDFSFRPLTFNKSDFLVIIIKAL